MKSETTRFKKDSADIMKQTTISPLILLLSIACVLNLNLHALDLSDISSGSNETGYVIRGEAAGDNLGNSVAVAGDVNGDGRDDLIIGAWKANVSSNSDAGKTYVVFGKATGTVQDLTNVSLNSNFDGFVINGIASEDFSGISVAAAGDVNADGFADILIGAYFADPDGKTEAGETYLVFGKADGDAVNLSDISLNSNANGFVIKGAVAEQTSGFSVAGGGDINADGKDDIIIGAPIADVNTNIRAGKTYIVYGKSDGTTVELSAIENSSNPAGFVINGIDPEDRSGSSVASAGDTNGDGLDDILIGAYLADPGGISDAGECYLIFGKTDGAAINLSDIVSNSNNQGFVINGDELQNQAGFSVSGAGDNNRDGLDDMIIGANQANPDSENNAGASYIIFGKRDGVAVNLSSVESGSGGYIINGRDFFDFSGESVSSAGDFNADGSSDVIIGAPFADPNAQSDSGESYLVYGKSGASSAVNLSSVANGSGGFVMNGISLGDFSGTSVSGDGDINGDGFVDVIVGASNVNIDLSDDVGETYVIFSDPDPEDTVTYSRYSRVGDGLGPQIVPVTDFGKVARVKIDFSDNDFADNGYTTPSLEIVAVNRVKRLIEDLVPLESIAATYWTISGDRENWEQAEITFKYTEHDISSIVADESELSIYYAEETKGPWQKLPTVRNPDRNELTATTTEFGVFLIAGPDVGPEPVIATAKPAWVEYY